MIDESVALQSKREGLGRKVTECPQVWELQSVTYKEKAFLCRDDPEAALS